MGCQQLGMSGKQKVEDNGSMRQNAKAVTFVQATSIQVSGATTPLILL
jgi:hypothetical protein